MYLKHYGITEYRTDTQTTLRHFDAIMTATQCLHPAPLPQPIGMHSLTTRTTERRENEQQDASLWSFVGYTFR